MEESKHEFLIGEFLEAVNDIGAYGLQKYGSASFQARRQNGDKSRGQLPRCQTQIIGDHIRRHMSEYQNGIRHDHFKTRKHQLGAVAFNAMMEFYFADLATEETPTQTAAP